MSKNTLLIKLKNYIPQIDRKKAFVITCVVIGIIFVSLFTPIYDIKEIIAVFQEARDEYNEMSVIVLADKE